MPALGLAPLDTLYDLVDTLIAEADGMLVPSAPVEEARKHYLACGQSALRAVQVALAAAGAGAEVRRILDLPCGHGRVLRFLKAAYPAAEIHACDLERSGVDFCAAQFGAKPIYSHPDPRKIHLPGGYDLIWVGSLLTHLDASRWLAFLTLFRTALAPGGVCVFTVHGHHSCAMIRSGLTDYGLKNPTALLRRYRLKGFAYASYPGQDYGISLSSPGWVCGQSASVRSARLVTYIERGWSDHHDVVAFAADPIPSK